ncbi:hypothetical protein ARMGADRAFT_1070643 [Armillaria gallica]|uniref:Uncharacterized protein n=1 Tax=Armillaria gallica TaxID=47427 RepID=A0A2H3EXT5_ARMGA|nr:hypothetical protein ARMGADRAFT_1070643 [Armillaria gallica]
MDLHASQECTYSRVDDVAVSAPPRRLCERVIPSNAGERLLSQARLTGASADCVFISLDGFSRQVQRDLVVNYGTADERAIKHVLAAQSSTPGPEVVAVEIRNAAYIVQQKASCISPPPLFPITNHGPSSVIFSSPASRPLKIKESR